MFLVEARYVVDNSQAAHFRADRLQHASAQSMALGEWLQRPQELVIGPLQFHEDGEEDSLMILITWEEYDGKFVQIVYARHAVETELRAQSEYERQRREVAEARVLALEVCANAWQAYVRSATAHALALSPQEQMRQHEGGTHDRSEGKASARVQRLEQQIVDMAAELAKLGELKF